MPAGISESSKWSVHQDGGNFDDGDESSYPWMGWYEDEASAQAAILSMLESDPGKEYYIAGPGVALYKFPKAD